MHFSACAISPLLELFFSSHPISHAVQLIVGLPLFSLLLAACCVQVEMQSSPGVACSLKDALKAKERGGQESDRLRQCWGKSLPKDYFSSWFTDQSRGRMRRRRDSENTQDAAAVSWRNIQSSFVAAYVGPTPAGVCGCSRTELLRSLLLTCSCISSCGTEWKTPALLLLARETLCLEVFLWCTARFLVLPLWCLSSTVGILQGKQLCLAVTSDLSNTLSHHTETMSHCCFTESCLLCTCQIPVQTLLICICNNWTHTFQMNANCLWRKQDSSNFQGMEDGTVSILTAAG